MQITVPLFLMIAGLILFILAGLGISGPRLNLGWYGAACVTAAFLMGG